LPRSMMSVVSQRYPRVELLVVSGHSPDNTAEVVRAFEDAHPGFVIRYIEEERNLGVSSSRNVGAKNANGDYIAFLDDDDELLPDYVHEVVRAFSGLGKEYGAVCTGAILVDARGWQSHAPTACNGRGTPGSGWTFRREVFFEGGLAYDTSIRVQEDFEFGLRFFRKYKGFGVDKPLRKYYFTEPSFRARVIPCTNTANREGSYCCYSRIFEMHRDFFLSMGDRDLSGEYLCWGLIAGRAGKMDAAREKLRKSLGFIFPGRRFFIGWRRSRDVLVLRPSTFLKVGLCGYGKFSFLPETFLF